MKDYHGEKHECFRQEKKISMKKNTATSGLARVREGYV
jgi:hypothetical protein